MKRFLQNERGSTLVLTIGLIVLLTGFSMTLIFVNAAGTKQTEHRGASMQAVKQAEVGMDHLIEEISSKANNIIQTKEQQAKEHKSLLTEEIILQALKVALKEFEGKTTSSIRKETKEQQKEKSYVAWFNWDSEKPTRLLLTSVGIVDHVEKEITLMMEITPKEVEGDPDTPPEEPEVEPERPNIVGQPIIYGYGPKGTAVIGGETVFSSRGSFTPPKLQTDPTAQLAHIIADSSLRTWPYSTIYNAGTNLGVWERTIPDVTLEKNSVPRLDPSIHVFETSTKKETWSPLNKTPRALTGATAAKEKEGLIHAFGGFVQPNEDYLSFADLPLFSKWYPNGKPKTNNAHQYSFIKDKNYPEKMIAPKNMKRTQEIRGLANFTTKGNYIFDEITVDGSAVIGRSTATFANSSRAFEDIKMKGVLRVKGDVYIQGADLRNTNLTIIADGNIYFHHNKLPSSSNNVKLQLFSRKHIVIHNLGTTATETRQMATLFAMADQSIHISTRNTPVAFRTSLFAPYVDVSGNKNAPLTLWALDQQSIQNNSYIVPFNDIWSNVHQRSETKNEARAALPTTNHKPSTSYKLTFVEP